jgi:hypothetical protein
MCGVGDRVSKEELGMSFHLRSRGATRAAAELNLKFDVTVARAWASLPLCVISRYSVFCRRGNRKSVGAHKLQWTRVMQWRLELQEPLRGCLDAQKARTPTVVLDIDLGVNSPRHAMIQATKPSAHSLQPFGRD